MLNEMMPERMPPADRRFDPIRQMQGAGRPEPGVRRPAFLSANGIPSLNLWTSPDGAIIAAEVPGVASEDLDITIQRDTVTVRGNRPPEPVDDSTVVHGKNGRTVPSHAPLSFPSGSTPRRPRPGSSAASSP